MGWACHSATNECLRTTTVVTNMPMSCMMNRVEGGSTFYSIPVGYHSMFWVGLGPAFHRMECLRLGTHTTFCLVCAFCVGLMHDQFSLILFFYLISIILYFLLRCKSSNLGPTWLPTSHRRNQRSAVTTLLDARGLCRPLLALPSEQCYCSTDD